MMWTISGCLIVCLFKLVSTTVTRLVIILIGTISLAITAQLLGKKRVLLSCCYLHRCTQSGSVILLVVSRRRSTQYLESSFQSFEYSLSELLPLLLAIQCLLFSQHNNSHRVGAAASLVATATVARVTYIWQLLLLWVPIAAELWEGTVEIGSTLPGSPWINARSEMSEATDQPG